MENTLSNSLSDETLKGSPEGKQTEAQTDDNLQSLTTEKQSEEKQTSESEKSENKVETREVSCFYQSNDVDVPWKLGCPIFDTAAKKTEFDLLPEYAEFARLQPSENKLGDKLFMNMHEPFAAAVVGLQGAGKSYTLNRIIENCTIPTSDSENKLFKPLTTLICHFDENPDTICQAVSLCQGNSPIKHIVVLASPSYYFQRKQMYSKCKNVQVIPLLFDFTKLGSQELKQMMGVESGQHQLYMSVILNALRQIQKECSTPSFEQFQSAINKQPLQYQQRGPLQQRLSLMKSFLFESKENGNLREKKGSVIDLFEPGKIIIADLTDPLIDHVDANRIFQVLVSLFRKKKLTCGKLLVFDEAHKYLDRTLGDLCEEVVRLVRQMRHYGLRILIATQSPEVLSRELLELSSFTILHRFSSPDWFRHLSKLIQLTPDSFETITQLQTGEALLSCSTGKITHPHKDACIGKGLHRILIRKRATMDSGFSVLNQ